MRVINAIKDLDSKEMLKFDLNKEKKRISLLQLLKLEGIIVFSYTFPLLSIHYQFKSEGGKEGKGFDPSSPPSPTPC